jgi:hypothetical protein
MFIFGVAVDWSRIIYYTITVHNCARNGALYLSDPYTTVVSPYANVGQAALADASNLSPAPTVDDPSRVPGAVTGTDADGTYVECTVRYTFKTVTTYPLPNNPMGAMQKNYPIVRTVRSYIAPRTPK